MKNTHINIKIYYITRVFVALRFIIPIWFTFFLRILTLKELAIGETIILIIASIFELPSGVLADLIGRKLTTAFGLILQGLGYILVTSAVDFQSYIIFFSISAIGGSFVSGAEEALVYDTLKENNQLDLYSKVKSNEAFIYRIILLFSTLLGGYLYKIRLILPYILTGTTLIIAGLIYFLAQEPNIDSEKFTFSSYLKQFRLGVKESFKDRITSLNSIYYILIFTGGLLLMSYFEQPYAIWLGFNEVQLGWIFALTLFIKIFTVLPSSFIEKKIGLEKISFVLPFLTGLILLVSFRNKIWGISILLLENILLAFRFIFTSKQYNQNIDSKFRASAISTMTMIQNILYCIFLLLISFVLDYKEIGYSFNLIGFLFLFASIISIIIHKDKIFKFL